MKTRPSSLWELNPHLWNENPRSYQIERREPRLGVIGLEPIIMESKSNALPIWLYPSVRQDLNLYRLYPKQARYQVTLRTPQRRQDLNLYYRLWRTAFYLLNYPSLWGGGDRIRTYEANAKGLQPSPFDHLGTPPWRVLPNGR